VSSPAEDALPQVGSVYVWELDAPHACELIKVTGVTWNGEEWWVRTERLHERLANTTYPDHPLSAASKPGEALNDLSRFWEAVTPCRLQIAPNRSHSVTGAISIKNPGRAG
jgi:hypothetical protein